MTITQNSERQYVLQGEVVVNVADFTGALPLVNPGESHEAIAVPKNAIVVGGQWITTTAWDDTGATETYDMACGDGGVRARYLPVTSAVDAATAAGQHLLVPTGFVYTADDDVSVSLVASSGAVAMSTGAGILQVMYTVTGRSNENQE